MATVSGKHTKQKWDMSIIRQLYMNGYELPEILNLDSCLSKSFIPLTGALS